MKKIIGIVLSLAAVVTLSSFVIAHNVNNNRTDNPESISANDGWEYYKGVTVKYGEGSNYKTTCYIWKKTVCGEPDYLLSRSSKQLEDESSISKNYYYANSCGDWRSEYKYSATTPGIIGSPTGYFSTYLPGWDK